MYYYPKWAFEKAAKNEMGKKPKKATTKHTHTFIFMSNQQHTYSNIRRNVERRNKEIKLQLLRTLLHCI